ncbi:hypothetical protein [Blastopirellula marina]|uniref:Uncharacterized protein n=1 Tax=Blastopirellula marina TaxID=124 RepID=A0A2S8GLX3_9BACT|nr:hypothetical protein [Blastopirellula marina]PQO45321.1 hypothetical protein C5Y93_15320 [Blastopirellula marina]
MIVSLSLNDLTQAGCSTLVGNPTAADVRNLLSLMDGMTRTELGVSDSDESGLVITGGFQGCFMCEYMSAHDNRVLINDNGAKQADLQIERDGDRFPAELVVDKEIAEQAALYFLTHEKLDPTWRWQ